MSDIIAKYRTKKFNAKIAGIEFKLSIDEYSKLMDDAGIVANDIGHGSNKYCLGRKCELTGKVDGDLHYSIGTCRFITNSENIIEYNENRILSSETKLLMGVARGMLGKSHSNETKAIIGKASNGNKNWLGKKHSDKSKKLIS